MEIFNHVNTKINLKKTWNRVKKTSFTNHEFKAKGIVVVCVVIEKKTGNFIMTTKNVWKKIKNRKYDYLSHAEFFAVKELKKKGNNLNDYYYIISFEPCEGCYKNVFLENDIDLNNVIIASSKVSTNYKKGYQEFKILSPETLEQKQTYIELKQNLNKISNQKDLHDI